MMSSARLNISNLCCEMEWNHLNLISILNAYNETTRTQEKDKQSLRFWELSQRHVRANVGLYMHLALLVTALTFQLAVFPSVPKAFLTKCAARTYTPSLHWSERTQHEIRPEVRLVLTKRSGRRATKRQIRELRKKRNRSANKTKRCEFRRR